MNVAWKSRNEIRWEYLDYDAVLGVLDLGVVRRVRRIYEADIKNTRKTSAKFDWAIEHLGQFDKLEDAKTAVEKRLENLKIGGHW